MRYLVRLILLLALLACIGVAGCGSDDDDGGSASGATTSSSSSDRDVIAKATKSTVSVAGAEGDFHSHGSGVIVDADKGLVLTTAHVIDTSKSIQIGIGDVKAKGRVVARAQCEDVALLAIYPQQSNLVAMPYGDSSALAAGDKVLTLGFPGSPKTGGVGEKVIATEGTVSSADTSAQLTELLPAFEELIAHQAPLAKNSTGGPLIDTKGNLVGMNVKIEGKEATTQPPGLYYAIPAARIKKLIAELTPGSQSLYTGWEKYHRCHGDMIELAHSVQVENHNLPPGYKATRGAQTSEDHSSH